MKYVEQLTEIAVLFVNRVKSDTSSHLAYAQTNIPIDIGHVVEDVGVWPPLLPKKTKPTKGKMDASSKGKINRKLIIILYFFKNCI